MSPELYSLIVSRVVVAWSVAAAVVVAVLLAIRALAPGALFALAVRVVAEVRTSIRDARQWAATSEAAVLGAITIAGALLRGRYLMQPVRTDEAATFLYYAFHPLAVGISVYASPNNHLLHTLLVHLVYGVTGDVPWALRLPSYAAGVLIVPATYWVARRFATPSAGLIAAALAAASPALVDYSALARGYSMMTLAFLAAMAIARRAVRDDAILPWLAIALVLAAGLWTVPLMTYAAGVIAAWIAVHLATIASSDRAASRREWLRFGGSLALAAGLTFIAYLPVLVVSGAGALFTNRYLAAQAARSILFDSADGVLATWGFIVEGLARPLEVMLALAALAGTVITLRDTSRSDTRVPFWIGVPLFVAPALALFRVVPYHRTWLFLVPVILILAGIGLEATVSSLIPARAFVWIALTLCLIGVALAWRSDVVYYSNETGSYRDAAGTTAFLKASLRPDDCVVTTVPSDVILMYEFARQRVSQRHFGASSGCRRAFMVVNTSAGQDLAWVLRETHVAPATPAHLVRRSESGAVYAIDLKR
ncbi:MAG TPA: glycosyltransferase family 39 protein [Thermoanaerobaculia bacterium]|nr:glycosyltransferase family 39 protein [Thermoanaerobaculia bacterium]